MVDILPLTLSKAEVRRAGKPIIGPIDLAITTGGATMVLGPNGAGKTTFLKACHGIARLASGGSDWAVERSEAELHQSYVFQSPILLRRRVLANVMYPLKLRGYSRSDAANQALSALTNVGLADAKDQMAHDLSGGEKQKLAIARALVTKPQVLFLDEPTASLDGRSKREIEAILIAAQRDGTKLIMTTHDLGQARRLAHHVVFLMHGKIHEEGLSETFFAGPKTEAAQAFLKGDIVE